jgi:radical SAM protein with 4Fe4S-binding SPASM domain
MTLHEFDRITDKLVGVTDYLYFHLMGEPLTHPDLPELLSLAADKGFKCAITTNGTLLSTRGEKILNSQIYKVNISLHSFEDGECEEHLRYLSEVASFSERAAESGILTVLRLWNKGGTDALNELTLDFLKQRLEGEWKWGVRGARIRHRLHLEYGDRFEWPAPDKEDGGESVFCYGLADHFGILCDGTVVPCCLDSDGNIPLGNILSEDIEDILSSQRATKIRDGFIRHTAAEDMCRRCGYARRFK